MRSPKVHALLTRPGCARPPGLFLALTQLPLPYTCRQLLLLRSAAPLAAIVGGGPAGLLAAQRLAEAGWRVQVFEQKATVGRKFLVAGHGGFNLTNSEDAATFARALRRSGAFFWAGAPPTSRPTDLRQWAADLGIATFVGTSGRVFPEAWHKPADLLRAWLHRLAHLGVELKTRHRWLGFVGEARPAAYKTKHDQRSI